jgi:hypothetical protein
LRTAAPAGVAATSAASSTTRIADLNPFTENRRFLTAPRRPILTPQKVRSGGQRRPAVNSRMTVR